ncbi:alpha/beta fold hydrolase [Streptomyces rhizosphaerihabitans]|nr:alpha/beta fold hydrolase [Streptomyces rhizosphaerihabitans]MCT9010790.1 alpha/beta fold hydrolase [Streptomyces rhizosphaerihabitans]
MDGIPDPVHGAQDLPAAQAAQMAAAQRPAAFATLTQPAGAPAWKTIPSWYLIARNDHTIPPAAERAMAARAHAHTVEINSSHAAMVSHPNAVTDLILDAATG